MAFIRTRESDLVVRSLQENEEIISAVVEKQKTGQIGECREFLKRLHSNLAFLAACADNQNDIKGGVPARQAGTAQGVSSASGPMNTGAIPGRDKVLEQERDSLL